MEQQCKWKVGETHCSMKYYSSGYCRFHYNAQFKKNRSRFLGNLKFEDEKNKERS